MFVSHEALGAEGPRTRWWDVSRGDVGKNGAAQLNMNAIDKCKADSGLNRIGTFGIFSKEI